MWGQLTSDVTIDQCTEMLARLQTVQPSPERDQAEQAVTELQIYAAAHTVGFGESLWFGIAFDEMVEDGKVEPYEVIRLRKALDDIRK